MHARMVGWAPHGSSLGSCSMQKELYLIRCLRRRLHLRARPLIKALLNSMTAPAQAAVDQERVLTRPRGERKARARNEVRLRTHSGRGILGFNAVSGHGITAFVAGTASVATAGPGIGP